jgi:hypothetical protein
LRNHAPDIAAMDLFVVPTVGFDLLYAFVIVRLDRRDLVGINVTVNPTAEWVARQITEAFPWNEAPRYLIRDRDRIYGSVVIRRLRAMGKRSEGALLLLASSTWNTGGIEGQRRGQSPRPPRHQTTSRGDPGVRSVYRCARRVTVQVAQRGPRLRSD